MVVVAKIHYPTVPTIKQLKVLFICTLFYLFHLVPYLNTQFWCFLLSALPNFSVTHLFSLHPPIHTYMHSHIRMQDLLVSSMLNSETREEVSKMAEVGYRILRLLSVAESKSLWSCLWLKYNQVKNSGCLSTIMKDRSCGDEQKNNTDRAGQGKEKYPTHYFNSSTLFNSSRLYSAALWCNSG